MVDQAYNKSKVDELMPSMKFIFNNELNTISSNQNKINSAFDSIKSLVEKKINTKCAEHKNKMIELGLLKEDFDEEEKQLAKDSLYQFIILQRDKYQNEIDNFTNCVENNVEEENEFLESYMHIPEKLTKSFYLCNTYMLKKYNFKDKTDEEAMKFYQQCLSKWTTEHTKFTEFYVKESNKLSSKI